jgi:hypothetical protein
VVGPVIRSSVQGANGAQGPNGLTGASGANGADGTAGRSGILVPPTPGPQGAGSFSAGRFR